MENEPNAQRRWEQECSFAAIDFETATPQRSSACALGVVVVDSGQIVNEQYWLIQPPNNEYDRFNTSVHGLSATDTKHAPSFDEVWEQAVCLVGNHVLVAHNASFDISVLRNSAAFHSYTPPEALFLCTLRLARSRLPDLGSWRLPDVCEALEVTGLNHHDALSDARAAAKVLLAMCGRDSSGVAEVCNQIGYKLGRLSNTIQRSPKSSRLSLPASAIESTVDNVDSDGALFGKLVAFTGTLDSMTRDMAFQVTVNSGGKPSNSVTQKTEILVLGMTDYTKVGTDGMSNKLRKAVALRAKGAAIEIIDENDFLRMADSSAFA